MKGRNFSPGIQRAKYFAVDFLMISLAFFLFNVYRFHIFGYSNEYELSSILRYLSQPKMIAEQILIPLGIMFIFWLSGYYNNPFNKSRVMEFIVTFWSIFASTAIIFLLLLINDSSGLKRKDYMIIIVLFGLMMTLVYTARYIITSRTIIHLRRRDWIYSTLIVGNSQRSRHVYRKLLKSDAIWSHNVVGFISIHGEHDVVDDMPSWPWEEVGRICAEHSIDQIILAPERNREAQIIHQLSQLFPLNIPVKIVPDTLSYITANIHQHDIMATPFIDLTSPRMSEFQINVKRLFDVVASAIALIILSPVLAATAIAVKRSSPGPVIYKQERMGRNRCPFYIYKFRSMRNDAEKDGPRLSSDSDDRITPVGRVMRKYRLDELPQFWNVIRGQMSIVGPRPEREYYIRRIVKSAPYYGLIFQVRPGITSWGMVKYGYARNVSEMVERSRYDLLYINNMSISTDIKIMIYTIRTIVKGAGI